MIRTCVCPGIEAERLVAQAEALDSEEDGRVGDDGYPRPLLQQKVQTS